MRKIALPLKHGEVELDVDRIRCDDIILPGEFNPHNKRLWVTMSRYGALGATWADNMGEALDELVDHDLAGNLLVDEKHLSEMDEAEQEELARLGNAGEPCDLTDVDVQPVVFKPERDWKLLCKFAEARGAGVSNLGVL